MFFFYMHNYLPFNQCTVVSYTKKVTPVPIPVFMMDGVIPRKNAVGPSVFRMCIAQSRPPANDLIIPPCDAL